MATATIIAIPVYQINSNYVVNRTRYPYGMSIQFASATLNVTPNTGDTLNELQAGRVAGGALIYSAIRTSIVGGNVFFSNLTAAAIAALANT